MLVDLGRNDVGRVAEYGTVHVTDLMAVERYSHVLHIVSQVEGAMRRRALGDRRLPRHLPGGHDDRRAQGPRDGDHRRTGARAPRAVRRRGRVHRGRRPPHGSGDHHPHLRASPTAMASVQAGAGIVADSVPEREWDETENKARAMLTAIGQVRVAQERPPVGSLRVAYSERDAVQADQRGRHPVVRVAPRGVAAGRPGPHQRHPGLRSRRSRDGTPKLSRRRNRRRGARSRIEQRHVRQRHAGGRGPAGRRRHGDVRQSLVPDHGASRRPSSPPSADERPAATPR